MEGIKQGEQGKRGSYCSGGGEMRKGEKQRENLKLHRLCKEWTSWGGWQRRMLSTTFSGAVASSSRDGPIPKRGSHPQYLFQWMTMLLISEMKNPKTLSRPSSIFRPNHLSIHPSIHLRSSFPLRSFGVRGNNIGPKLNLAATFALPSLPSSEAACSLAVSILQDAAAAADVRPNLGRGCAKVHLTNEGRGGMEGERSQVGAFAALPPCQSLGRDGRYIVAMQRGLVAHLPLLPWKDANWITG